MKILVPVKRVPDPTQKAKIKDGHIDLTGASWIVNTFDEYAVETALRLLENGADGSRIAGGEIIVVSLGPADTQKELRTTLAMGADRAIHVECQDSEIDSLAVVKVLKGIIDAEKPDLVVMGKQAVDGDANQVGQMLAGKLGWVRGVGKATTRQADPADSAAVIPSMAMTRSAPAAGTAPGSSVGVAAMRTSETTDPPFCARPVMSLPRT